MGKIDFEGKTALISGAGSGIGYELALEFARKGADIIATDIRPERLDGLCLKLNSYGIRVFTYVVDTSDRYQVKDLADKVLSENRPVDILYCGEGVGHRGSIGEISIDEWEWVFAINYWSQVYLIDQFLPRMKNLKQGWIMITASRAGLFPIGGMAANCSTKSAMVSLAKVLQIELRQDNINVSALCPGIISTNIIKDGIIQVEKNQAFGIKMYGKIGIHPSKIAKVGVKGLWKNKAIIRTPFYHSALNHFLYTKCPSILLRFGSFLYKRGWNFTELIVK